MALDERLPRAEILFEKLLVVLKMRKKFFFVLLGIYEPYVAIEFVNLIGDIGMTIQNSVDSREVLASLSVRNQLVAVENKADVRICSSGALERCLLPPPEMKVDKQIIFSDHRIDLGEALGIRRELGRAGGAPIVATRIESYLSVALE